MAREIIHVVYARKPVDWHEIESGSRPDCGEAIPTQVSEIREMTEVEYNAFIARPLAKREWLAGKGGYQGNIKQAVALVCPGRETSMSTPQALIMVGMLGVRWLALIDVFTANTTISA